MSTVEIRERAAECAAVYDGVSDLRGKLIVQLARDVETCVGPCGMGHRELASGGRCDAMTIKLRPEVRWFAEEMERCLRLNDHKGGWEHMSLTALGRALDCELTELWAEIGATGAFEHLTPRSAERIICEAADVANFAMMVADNARRAAGGRER